MAMLLANEMNKIWRYSQFSHPWFFCNESNFHLFIMLIIFVDFLEDDSTSPFSATTCVKKLIVLNISAYGEKEWKKRREQISSKSKAIADSQTKRKETKKLNLKTKIEWNFAWKWREGGGKTPVNWWVNPIKETLS